MKASQGNTLRKKLADISNMAQAGIENAKPQHKISIGSKEHIEMLQKENVTLMKLLSDRNKFIEITGAEMQNMRINLQKLQQQNQQLAKSNSQMLVELNSAKDRLKAFQHELGCKNALFKAKKLEAEEIAKQEMRQQLNDEVTAINCEEAGDSSLQNEDNEKPANSKRRLQSKSLGSSKQVQPQVNAENKRPCVRRQSARFAHEDSFKEEDKCPPLANLVQPNGSTSFCTSPNELNGNPASSLSRPLRQAAKKVQSYKEIPVNIKMRRPA